MGAIHYTDTESIQKFRSLFEPFLLKKYWHKKITKELVTIRLDNLSDRVSRYFRSTTLASVWSYKCMWLRKVRWITYLSRNKTGGREVVCISIIVRGIIECECAYRYF